MFNQIIVKGFSKENTTPLPSTFLFKVVYCSLAGPIHDLVKRASDRAAAEYSSLEMKGRSMEERLAFTARQTDTAQRDAQEWKKRYEMSMNDYKKSTENATAQYSALQKKVTTLEERRGNLGTQLESAKKQASDWQSKYQQILSERRAEEERLNSEVAGLQVSMV